MKQKTETISISEDFELIEILVEVEFTSIQDGDDSYGISYTFDEIEIVLAGDTAVILLKEELSDKQRKSIDSAIKQYINRTDWADMEEENIFTEDN